MIRQLASGRYRLYSRKLDPNTGKRRNLGTFTTRAAAEKHERAVQYFKHHRRTKNQDTSLTTLDGRPWSYLATGGGAGLALGLRLAPADWARSPGAGRTIRGTVVALSSRAAPGSELGTGETPGVPFTTIPGALGGPGGRSSGVASGLLTSAATRDGVDTTTATTRNNGAIFTRLMLVKISSNPLYKLIAACAVGHQRVAL